MQVRAPEVDHAGAVGGGDVGLADVPFVGDRPVEHPSAARHLGAGDRDVLAQDVERCSDSVAGHAAAEREQSLHQLVCLLADLGVGQRQAVGRGEQRGAHANTALRQ